MEEENKVQQQEPEVKENVNKNDLVISKFKSIKTHYKFSLNYSNQIMSILVHFYEMLSEKISNNINEGKKIQKFLIDSITFYSNLSNQYKQQSILFKDNPSLPKILDVPARGLCEANQFEFAQTFTTLSTNLKKKLNDKTVLPKAEQLCSSIEQIEKEIVKRLGKIEHRRKKLMKLHDSKYKSFFDEFMPQKNQPNNNLSETLNIESIQDLIVIDLQFSTAVNKLVNKTMLCLSDIKDHIININSQLLQFHKAIANGLYIYSQESKGIFGTNSLKKSFNMLEVHFESTQKPNQNELFLMERVFITEDHKNKINKCLQTYQKLLKDSQRVESDIIFCDNRFNINNYTSINELFETLIKVNPQFVLINFGDLLVKQFKIKRDPGLFSSWKNCVFIISKQNHIIIYDGEIAGTPVNVFEMSRITFRKKEGKKGQYLFEIVVNKKGKVMNFSGTFLYDAQNNETLSEIEKILNVKK